MALWLYATIDAVGSARELARLCEAHVAYRWLCGGVSMNHHTLADFRVAQVLLLDRLLAQGVASLVSEGLVTLERLAQDGVRIRASAGASLFRRRDRLESLLAEAEARVAQLKRELEADPAASTARQQAARERAARERVERTTAALRRMQELEAERARREKTHKKATQKHPHGRPFCNSPGQGQELLVFRLPSGRKSGSHIRRPSSDPEITKRVTDFQEIKSDLRSRRKLVSTLTREAGLPAPERFTGEIVAALSSAGLFRVRGVLVGTVAFPCYAGILGVRLPSTAMQTSDADFAQFHSISAAVGDSIPPILDLIKKVDPSFRETPNQADGRMTTAFENRFALQNRISDAQSRTL